MRQSNKGIWKVAVRIIVVAFLLCATDGLRSSDKVLAAEENNTSLENKVTIETKLEKKEFANKKGDVRLILSYQYPQLTGDYAGIDKINEAYRKQYETWFAAQEELIHMIQEEETFYSMNENDVVFRVTYNKNGILGVLHEGYVFTGGAHGMPYRTPTIYDLQTGEPLDAMTLLKKDEKALKAEVEKAFAELFAKDPDLYWEEANEIVKKMKLSEIGYYLTDAGIVFYMDPYVVAPYAAGFVEVTVS